MTRMRRLRTWAEDNGHEIKVERTDPETESGGTWRISVRLEESVLFEATSGWQDSVETAARLVLEQLLAVGEDVPD